MTRIFLPTLSNQYNAYNLIYNLWQRTFKGQQKQRKQLTIIDDKNIFTYSFQPIQRLQPNFKIEGIRNFIYNKHNGDKAKLRLFSLKPQRQRIQSNFMNYPYQSMSHNIGLYKYNQSNDIKVGFTTRTKFMLLQLRQRNFWSIHIQILQLIDQYCSFHPSPICTLHRSRKTCTWLDEQFRTFHPSLHESVAPLKSL